GQDQVDPRDPARLGAAERPRLPRKLPGDGDPAAHRRKPVRRAEPRMAEPRAPFEVRIDDEADERDGPQPADDVRELEDGDEVEREGARAEDEYLHARQL